MNNARSFRFIEHKLRRDLRRNAERLHVHKNAYEAATTTLPDNGRRFCRATSYRKPPGAATPMAYVITLWGQPKQRVENSNAVLLSRCALGHGKLRKESPVISKPAERQRLLLPSDWLRALNGTAAA